MKRYEIPCTEEQAGKALKLGAPIKHKEVTDFEVHLLDYNITEIPTAEEMVGWLEEQGIQITLHVSCFNEWGCMVYNTLMLSGLVFESSWRKTRKEATLAAIDAALDYLSNNKK